MKKIMNISFGNYLKKIKNRRSFICGINSHKLNKNEIIFLKKYKPWGVILFARNIKNKSKFETYLSVYINQISYLMKLLGININAVPVLDLYRSNSHKIIGNRSFSSSPFIASKIGDKMIKKFLNNGIFTIIKHIPGHGLAKSDSHKYLPIVNKNLRYLLKNDFKVFKKKKSMLAMTAHILFKKIDKVNCATHSKKIIKIIRKSIGFKNIIMSDDISMKALKFTIETNTIMAFDAGCDLVLHCNGKLKQMVKVAENSPLLSNFLIKKTSQMILKLS